MAAVIYNRGYRSSQNLMARLQDQSVIVSFSMYRPFRDVPHLISSYYTFQGPAATVTLS